MWLIRSCSHQKPLFEFTLLTWRLLSVDNLRTRGTWEVHEKSGLCIRGFAHGFTIHGPRGLSRRVCRLRAVRVCVISVCRRASPFDDNKYIVWAGPDTDPIGFQPIIEELE